MNSTRLLAGAFSFCATLDQRVGYDLEKGTCPIMGIGVQTRR